MLSLQEFCNGESAKIIGFGNLDKAYQHKLMAMGLTLGIEFKIIRRAPMGDPIAIDVRGCCVCLRQQEAQGLLLEKVIS